MTETHTFRGGARIGWVNASWPFGKLSVNAERLTLSGMGQCRFAPADVVAIEPHGSLPVLSRGLRIRHNRPDLPETAIFWCVGSRDKVLDALKRSGFAPQGQAAERSRGFPARWPVVIGVVLLWNLLLLFDPSVLHQGAWLPGPLSLLALLLLFASATATRISPRWQRWVMKPGHQVGEIRGVLTLLQLVSGFLLLIFGSFHFIGGT